MKKILLLTFIIIARLISSSVASAQEPAPTNENQLNETEQLKQDIEQQQEIYRGQLTQYKDDERNFVVATEQLKTIDTLEAIEDQLQSYKKVLITRAQVLTTYTRLVRLQLLLTPGAPNEFKQSLLFQLEESIARLDQQAGKLTVATDKRALSSLSLEFESYLSTVNNQLFASLSLIRYGRLQMTLDKLQLFKDDVGQILLEKYSEQDLQKGEVERALLEVQSVLDEAKSGQQAILIEFGEAYADEKSSFKSFYKSLSDDLTPVYADLSRGYNFLEELTKGRHE